MRQLAYAFGLITLVAQGLAAQPANAPVLTDEAYSKTMKQIGPTFQTLIKNNESMDHAAGVNNAQKLEQWFNDVQRYWEAKKVPDAVAFAKTAATAAQTTVSASVAMNMQALEDAQKALTGACQGCHTAHRERLPDGTFKIK